MKEGFRGRQMSSFSFVLPADFDEYEWEVTSKGCFSEARITVAGRRYRLNFYDPVRLGQEIESEFRRGGMFFEPNLVVVPSVTRSDMERAVELLLKSGQMTSLIPE
jgi:hypothetical protein